MIVLASVSGIHWRFWNVHPVEKGGTIVHAQVFGEIKADPLPMSTVPVLQGPATGFRLHQHPFKVGGSEHIEWKKCQEQETQCLCKKYRTVSM